MIHQVTGRYLRYSTLFLSWLLIFPMMTQAQPEQSIITAENVDRLQSDVTIDFALLNSFGWEIGAGIFVVNHDASIIMSFAKEGSNPPLSTAIVWDGRTGELIKGIQLESNFYDRLLTPDGKTLLVAGENEVIAYQLLDGARDKVLEVEQSPVVEVWLNQNQEVCAEIFPLEGSFVFCAGWDAPLPLFDQNPDNSRIGRVPPPYAVTSTEQGEVRLWDMESNTVLTEAKVNDVAVFGAINASASHLAWRNPESTELHLLDFATGTDKQIATLSGAFISYLLLAPQADVILGIDPVDARSEIIVWDTGTGEKSSLGKYRSCNRQQPDFAQLSPSGTALIIGCDTGLDVWRIKDN